MSSLHDPQRRASASEVARLLRTAPAEVERLLGVAPVQMSLPTDGMGVRIKASVREGFAKKVPKSIVFRFDADEISIPVETVEDYQDFSLLRRPGR